MPHLIAYDRECRFCRWSLGWILRWDRHGALTPLALQDPGTARLLGSLEEEERMASWHLIGPGGAIASAGAAFPPLLRLLPGGRVPAALTAGLPRLTERAYRLVADHRGALSRPLSDAAIARADELIARRSNPRAEEGVSPTVER